MSSELDADRGFESPSVQHKRILVLSPWGLGGGYSGPLTLLDRMCSALASQGATIDVVYRDRGREATPPWVNEAISIGDYSRFGRREQIRWGLSARRIVRRRANDYDAIHLHGFYLANQVAISGFRGTQSVVAMPVLEGGDLATSAIGWDLKSTVARHALRSVTQGLALSDGIASDFVTLGQPASAVRVVGNPADEHAFRVGRSRSGRQDRPVIGFVGKVGGFKNPDLVLKATARLRQRGHDLAVLVVGPIENEKVHEQLRSIVATEDLEDVVEFAGFSTDVPQYLARMDVFVLPSSREGLPGALCEAMAAGLPCVVSDVGSMGSHVRAAGAGLVVATDVDDVAEGIESALFENWAEWSGNAHEYALGHFSSDELAATYLHVIDSPQELPTHG